jgi:hypothetical protein
LHHTNPENRNHTYESRTGQQPVGEEQLIEFRFRHMRFRRLHVPTDRFFRAFAVIVRDAIKRP